MSQRHSEYALIEMDEYYTPAWVTVALLSKRQFPGVIWEPAPGEGHMVEALTVEGQQVTTTVSDFLNIATPPMGTRSIVTNPPYSGGLAEGFIRHALDLMRDRKGKVAMLLPIAFDSAKSRRDIFADHAAFAAKYTLTKRIRWTNLEQKKNGPSQNHAWFFWDWRNSGRPICGYLP